MVKVITIASITLLAGCSSLQNAGTVEYSVEPIVTESTTICCKVSVKNGKEYGALKAHVKKTGGDYEVTLEETGVAAFKGQQVSADALKTAVEAAVKAAALPYGGAALGGGLQLLK